jgi:hypothetical protein
MISNTRCKQILNQKNDLYSIEEIEVIKKVLYQVAELYLKNKK